ncbi:MAG: TrkH family potassium uptake protein [Candidatus Omnitrophica bacterium]|nr:TrkH family potassium uptake protein [Candidatus Omnitrophota bacterium]
MILKPRLQDAQNIGYYLGKIIIGLGVTMAVPLAMGLLAGELNPSLDFLIALEITVSVGLLLTKVCITKKELTWMQGMIVVALAWLVATVLGAIPLYLSGHWLSYLDACFDTMSGLATTGLVLAQDIDHMSLAHNLWRHLIMFIGGQGVVIVALSFLVKGFSGAFRMYVGEARDERIHPNVIHTSRFIWLVSLTFLVLGTLSLGIVGVLGGMQASNAFFHGICVFMAAFDTGGFAPQSQNILYYHSFAYEAVTAVIMLLGAINFRLHYHIWAGNRKEILKNIETIFLFASILILFSIVAVGLTQINAYQGAGLLFRKGFYQLLSAHTGTGFQTIYAAQFIREWNHVALVAIIGAMALGGSICSTTGAIKMLRLGIVCKAITQDIKRIMLPDQAIVIKKFHHVREVFLNDALARSALGITVSYLGLYGVGAAMGMLFGYPFLDALFESTSAAANVGLSCGITTTAMPPALKITYIIQMWAGRLEFVSVFTLIGFFVAAIKGKR